MISRQDVTQTMVALTCGYEMAAIFSRYRIPTLSALQRKHRLLGAVIVGALIYHFIVYPEALREDLRDAYIEARQAAQPAHPASS